MRQRLESESTRLLVGETSTGSIVARRWTRAGWIDGGAALGIEHGELTGSVTTPVEAPPGETPPAEGDLRIGGFGLSIAPIDIPLEVFSKPAQLTDLQLRLRAPASGTARWEGDNDLRARLEFGLDLRWSITIDGGKTPLGTQALPPIDVDVALTGNGEVVEATLAVSASGELWNWVGLLKLADLELALNATTLDSAR